MKMADRNKSMTNRGLADYSKEFAISFRDRKKVFFEIQYGELQYPTQDAHFSTSASELNYRRTDYSRCGQAQEALLKNKDLKAFYEKWDVLHLKVLTIEQYEEMMRDIEDLKEKLPYIESKSFSRQVEFDREMSK